MFERTDLLAIRAQIAAKSHYPPSLPAIHRVLVAAVELEIVSKEGDDGK